MSLSQYIENTSKIFVQQRKELVELIGIESRNKYVIEDAQGQQIGFAAEQQKGFSGFLMRQYLGHWRSFDILVFDTSRQVVLQARHPFRFYFQRLQVSDSLGNPVGAMEKRFAFFSKRFAFEDSFGRNTMSVSSPVWRIWTFPVMRDGQKVALITKRWGGVLREAFTDADRFELEFLSPELSLSDKQLLLAATIFIDLQYFEVKANSRSSQIGSSD